MGATGSGRHGAKNRSALNGHASATPRPPSVSVSSGPWLASTSAAPTPRAAAGALYFGAVDGVRVVGEARQPAELRGTGELGDVAWSTAPRVGAHAIFDVDERRAHVVARAGGDPFVVVSGAGVAIA